MLGLWTLRTLLLLVFAGILGAIFLRGLTNWLVQWSRLPEGVGLALVVLVLLALFSALWIFLAPGLPHQTDQLFSTLPGSIRALEEQVAQYSWGRKLLQQTPAATQILPDPGDLLSQLGGAFTTAFGILANVIIVLIIALFLAIDPPRYLDGLVQVFRKAGGPAPGKFSPRRVGFWAGG